MNKKIFLAFLFMYCSLHAEMLVSFEPDQITIGESAQLILQSDKPIKSQPDLSKLIGTFAVAGRTEQSSIIEKNGRSKKVYQLIFNVFPRKEGLLSADVTVEGYQLTSTSIEVLPQDNTSIVPIKIEAFVDKKEVYPQETFFYTIKMIDAIGLLDGKMTNPEITHGSIQALNMDKGYRDYIYGQSVQVFERTFAITPDDQGPVTIAPVELYGKIITQSEGSQAYSSSYMGGEYKEVRLETDSLQVTILPKPINWQGWWLPSKNVKITVQDDFLDNIVPGDSLRRVVKITALGTTMEQLPKIPPMEAENLKVYLSPEKRELVQTPQGDIQGILETSMVFVPVKEGNIVIPGLKIPWFNTETQSIETVEIPGTNIQVQPSKEGVILEDQEQNLPEVKLPTRKKIVSPQKGENTPVQRRPAQKRFSWFWIYATGTFLSMIVLIVILIRKQKQPTVSKEKIGDKSSRKLPDLYPF